MPRPPRLAFVVLPGLDHFVPDLARGLAATGRLEVGVFPAQSAEQIAAALAWADQPATDVVWFEFCWPPFPALIAATDFGGRRVVVRVHRIEAYGTGHVARVDWSRVDDVIVVGEDMRARTLAAAPEIAYANRLHVVHNGVDLDRFVPLGAFDPFRIGWCGWFTLHKNPALALQVLHRLRRHDARYRLAITSKEAEPVTLDGFRHLAARLGLADAIAWDGAIEQAAMPNWHARNGALLSTSVYESFGYAIAEAAACGCDIAMLDQTAAGEFWPEATRFADIDEAVEIIRAARPHRWRALVAERFSLDRQVARVLELLCAGPAAGEFDSGAYWEQRYRRGGNSGAGSYGRLAGFKAETLNAIVAEHAVASVIEFGCGDGAQLSLARYPAYVGVDVAPSALALCRARFAHNAGKRFVTPAEAAGMHADLAVSLDVVFHLVEPATFDGYMRALFAAGQRLVVVYASDRDGETADAHVRHRAFSRWVEAHAPEWRRSAVVHNPFPFDPARPEETSFSDFHVFERVAADQNVGSDPQRSPALQAA